MTLREPPPGRNGGTLPTSVLHMGNCPLYSPRINHGGNPMADLMDLFTNASAADHRLAAAYALGWATAILLITFLHRAARRQGGR